MVLADTGYWVALANARDRWHETAVAATRELYGPLVVTWPVVTEACHLILTRLGVTAQLSFVEQLPRCAEVYEIAPDRLGAIRALMGKYASLPMDLADATLVLAATERGDGRILSTDWRDFDTYRWKDTEPFQNLLRPS